MNIVILITTKNLQEAKKISRALLNEKLIACVNIVSGVQSLFWWQGKVDRARESLLIIKTKKRLLPKIIKRVKELHSYDVPEVIALPLVGGNPDYLKWITKSTN